MALRRKFMEISLKSQLRANCSRTIIYPYAKTVVGVTGPPALCVLSSTSSHPKTQNPCPRFCHPDRRAAHLAARSGGIAAINYPNSGRRNNLDPAKRDHLVDSSSIRETPSVGEWRGPL